MFTMSGFENRGSKRKPELENSAEDPDYAFARDIKRSKEDDEQRQRTITEGRTNNKIVLNYESKLTLVKPIIA